MKSERFEVRLREGSKTERQLLVALKELGEYGEKSALMRDWIGRGYSALSKRFKELAAEGADEELILTELARILPQGVSGYRVAKTFLDARKIAFPGELRRLQDEPPQPPRQIEGVSSQNTDAPALGGSLQDLDVAESKAALEQGTSDVPAVRGRSKKDWSSMRGIAGATSKDSGGGSA